MKNQYIGGELPKRWALNGLQKKGDVFEGRLRPPMKTMSWRNLPIDTNIQSKKHCSTVILLIIVNITDAYLLPISKKLSGITNLKNSN